MTRDWETSSPPTKAWKSKFPLTYRQEVTFPTHVGNRSRIPTGGHGTEDPPTAWPAAGAWQSPSRGRKIIWQTPAKLEASGRCITHIQSHWSGHGDTVAIRDAAGRPLTRWLNIPSYTDVNPCLTASQPRLAIEFLLSDDGGVLRLTPFQYIWKTDRQGIGVVV